MKISRNPQLRLKRHSGAKQLCSICGRRVRNVADHRRDAHKEKK